MEGVVYMEGVGYMALQVWGLFFFFFLIKVSLGLGNAELNNQRKRLSCMQVE